MCYLCMNPLHDGLPDINDVNNGAVFATITESGDAAASTSTTASMSVGDVFVGTLDSNSDSDWIAITLTDGEDYTFTLDGAGGNPLSDPYLRLRDSSGTLITYDDDGGPGYDAELNYTATYTGTYYLDAQSWANYSSGDYELGAELFTPPAPATYDQLAAYLTDGYWNDNGGSRRSFDTSSSNQIKVNITKLTADGQQLARWAFEAWEMVADIEFVEVTSGEDIDFDDTDTNSAYASYSLSGGEILSSFVNVGTGWLSSYGTTIDTYSFQTYVHEIGHAIGLGHQGDYNGSATFGSDNTYSNDSWQESVMSYFSQTENTNIIASRAYTGTTMIADQIAIWDLYGAAGSGSATAGDTTWGNDSDLGNYLDDLWEAMFGTANASVYSGNDQAFTIYDFDGHDLLDLSNDTSGQTISLEEEAINDVFGLTGNLIISRNTVIEDYIGGSGNDTITGNAADNTLDGRAGNDTINGLAGDDILIGGLGADTMDGGADFDTLSYEGSSAAVTVNLATNSASGGDAAGDTFSNMEGIIGSDHADTLTGDSGNNAIEGGASGDTLDGGAGTDFLVYSRSSAGVNVNLNTNTLSGGDAAGDVISNFENLAGSDFRDVLTGDGSANEIHGLLGNDTLQGLNGDDVLRGGEGDDILRGGGHSDTLYGEEDDDLLEGGGADDTLDGGDGEDTLDGGAGADALDGGDDEDTATYEDSASGVTVSLATGTGSGGDAQGDTLQNIENLIGSDQDDTLIGDANDNDLSGGAGDDILRGGAGADYLDGGADTDTADYSTSGAGVEINLLTTVTTGGDATGDTLFDIENLIGSAFADLLVGDNGINELTGGDEDDVLNGRAGADTLNGGNGTDTASYEDSFAGVNINLANNTASGGEATGDILSSIENLTGSAFNDTLTGDGGANELSGGAFNDVLNGGGGDDFLFGGDNDDILEGGAGADVLNGGSGNDTATYFSSATAVNIHLGQNTFSGGDAAGDTLTDIENIIGTRYNDTITGDNSANTITGKTGIDTINGQGGADTIYGDGGNDVIRGGGGNDTVYGGNGGDWIYCSNGTNTIYGEVGKDRIYSGVGADIMDGGADEDTLYYNYSTSGVSVNLGSGGASGGYAQGDQISNFENVYGSNYSDVLTGDAGDNILFGRNGSDSFYSSGGADFIKGGGGTDQITYTSSLSAVTVNLRTGVGSGGEAQGDTYQSIERAVGTRFNDTLIGQGAANLLAGNEGNDTIDGGGGADIIYGGMGNDDLTGGSGADEFRFEARMGDDIVQDFREGQGDKLQFDNHPDVAWFGDLTVQQDGADTLITVNATGDTITLIGINANTIDAGDFIF